MACRDQKMNPTAHPETANLWSDLLQAQAAYSAAFQKFLTNSPSRVDVLRSALRGKDRQTALAVAKSLTLEEKKALFSEWVFLISWAHGAIQTARDILLSLPRPWVLERIEKEVEPYLQNGTEEEFRRFLEFFEILDEDLLTKLAQRAAVHADPDIKEAGADFLAKTKLP
jgi:hypothetical protein